MRVLEQRKDGVIQTYHKKSKETPEYWKGKTVLTEREVNLIKNRINSGVYKPFARDEGWDLSSDQIQKGYKWLMSQYKTPLGVERKNNPFGYREQRVLDTFEKIMLKDWYSERGNWYAPYYLVEGSDGTFEYYVSGGKINILG